MRHYSGTATLHTPPVWRAPEGTGGLRDDAPGFPTPERRAFLYSSARLCYKHTRPLRPPLTKVAGNLGPLTFHRYRERRGISTIPFQISKGLHGNCMRHFWGTTASGHTTAPTKPGQEARNHATQTRGSPTGRRAFTQLVHTLNTVESWGHSTQSRVQALSSVERSSTQRSRAATTSATWTAFRAAPLRRLSPETTRTRPRLPSTA